MEKMLIRCKINGVMRNVPIGVEHLTWSNDWDRGDGKSRIYALATALEQDLGLRCEIYKK